MDTTHSLIADGCLEDISWMLPTFIFVPQISDHLDIGRDESDESKIASLSSIHAVGDPLFVKVRVVSSLSYFCCTGQQP